MKRLLLAAAVLLLGCTGAAAQDVAISANAADLANFGTLGVEASCALAQHWSLNAGVKYNPFSYSREDNILQNKQRSVSAGTRYWPWHIYSGWWLSGAVRYQEYNSGGISSPETSEGDRFGGTLGGGYTYMVAPHINLDFGIGMWGGYDIYRTYSCPTCGRVVAEGRKMFVMPGDIIMALTYIF